MSIMAESVEHQFLSNCITHTLNDLSRSNLYAYVEAERRKFDFACELVRDWSRPLVGQTLWNHTAGVDKDLRTMLLDPEAEICAYIARDTVQARRLLSEVMRDFRSSKLSIGPHRLRVFWIPQDFDADDEGQRDLITEQLSDNVTRDILMNIVFGNFTAGDVRFFVKTSGTPGLQFAVLHKIATAPTGHLTNKDLAESLGVSPGSIRERLLRLLGCGFLSQTGGGAFFANATPKGRLFLDFCGELLHQTRAGELTPELRQILRLLDMRYAPSAFRISAESLHIAGPFLTDVPEMVTARLLALTMAAIDRWKIDLRDSTYIIWNTASEAVERGGGAVDPFVERLREESEPYL